MNRISNSKSIRSIEILTERLKTELLKEAKNTSYGSLGAGPDKKGLVPCSLLFHTWWKIHQKIPKGG